MYGIRPIEYQDLDGIAVIDQRENNKKLFMDANQVLSNSSITNSRVSQCTEKAPSFGLSANSSEYLARFVWGEGSRGCKLASIGAGLRWSALGLFLSIG